MQTIATPDKTLTILKKFNFKFSKSLGQNFLVDNNILEKIVKAASLSFNETVLEIGPGIGTLTLALAQKVKKVIAVEVDKTLIPILKEVLKNFNNVEVIQTDALKFDLNMFPKNKQPSKLISNLPYNIATPLLIKFLTNYPQLKSYVFMVQKEVAKRIVASPGGRQYGISSVKIQYLAQPKILFSVSKNVFIPRPKIDSAVVRLERILKPKVKVKHQKLLFKVIDASFSPRRKTIKNALAANFPSLTLDQIQRLLVNANVNPQRRGETLKLEEFARVTSVLEKSLELRSQHRLPTTDHFH